MNAAQKVVPQEVIEIAARSLFKETMYYGFNQLDYIRFVNFLLDLSMKQNNGFHDQEPSTPITFMQPNSSDFPLVGGRIQIRRYHDKADRRLFKKWLTDQNGRYFLLSRLTSKKANIAELVRDQSNILGIITLPDSQPIGMMAFLNNDQIQRKAELRKLIGEPEFRGKGLAKEATKLWIEYGIYSLGLKKIYLNTLDTNIRNIKLNEELGFRVEGILRNECLIDGEYHDILKMGLLCDEIKRPT